MSPGHKLAAIVFADITGYTALMQENEQNALEVLNRFKEVIESLTPQYEGRIVQYFGDGCLLAFESSTQSVDCSIAIQVEFNKMPRVPVRIGIHLGDIVFRNENAFGDGVNIASRIESLGIPGSVLLSKTIRDHIANKTAYQLTSLGSFNFKNVADPIEVFAVSNPGLVVPKRKQMQGKLKPARGMQLAGKWMALVALLGSAIILWFTVGKTLFANTVMTQSIAVLPFADMSAGKDQTYFSEGLSEELLNLLAKTPELKVIGRTSSFSFKGKNEDLKTIGRKLGVAHLLEGSVRKSGNTVRVTAQLIKAEDGSHVWSETYDSELKDVLQLQDEIATAVVKQLKMKLLAPGGQANFAQTDPRVYNLVLQGNFFLDKRDKESQQKALSFYQQALAIDSLNSRAWAGMAKCYILQSTWNYINYKEGYRQAAMAANKTIELDPKNADAYRVLGALKMRHLDWKGAEVEYNKALKLEPGHADALRIKGMMYNALGRYKEAEKLIRKSIELDPLRPIVYLNLALSLSQTNRIEEGIASCRKALELDPALPSGHTQAGILYLKQDKPELALQELVRDSLSTGALAMVHYALGNKKEADLYLREMINNSEGKAFRVAEIYAFRGENDKAFAWLDKSFDDLEPDLLSFKNSIGIKKLENDPRYPAYLKKMRFPTDLR